MVCSYTWRAALNVCNSHYPPVSTCTAFCFSPVGSKLRKLPQNSPQFSVDVYCLDEFSFVHDAHFMAMCAQACKATGRADAPFGGRHVALFGDPRQHKPPGGTPLFSHTEPAPAPDSSHAPLQPAYCPRAPLASATMGAMLYKDTFETVVMLTQQQRTPCLKLHKYSRLFARSNEPCLHEITEFCDALNACFVPIESINADIVRAVVLRNEIRAAINWRLASRHARRTQCRPIAWHAVDTVVAGCDTSEQRRHVSDIVKLLPASDTAHMNAATVFFEGCVYLFVDNDAPALGCVKTATCIGRGLLLDLREPPDPGDAPVWWLNHPPVAIFVQSMEVDMSASSHAALAVNYPTLPPKCVASKRSDVCRCIHS